MLANSIQEYLHPRSRFISERSRVIPSVITSKPANDNRLKSGQQWHRQDPETCADWYYDRLDDAMCTALLSDRSVETPHDVVQFIENHFNAMWHGAPCFHCGESVSANNFVLVDELGSKSGLRHATDESSFCRYDW